jgi:hypothetical protein
MNGTPLTPRLAGALAAALLLAACATAVPVVPYPDVVQAPHPLGLAEAADAEAVLETYSASPNRNPDGLGTLDALWLNSRMTLVPWPVARAREAANRLAYARTAEEHERVLAEARALYAQHWVFEGLLLSDVPAAAQVDFYLPDGVYLVDDRGRRFRPQVARNADPLTTARAISRFGEAHYGYPRLVFPAEAITAETRAVSLYFAALNRRLRFTWVFDPTYELPPGPGLGSGRETNRLFPAR